MKRVCIRCGKDMRDETGSGDLCEQCVSPVDSPVRMPVREYLDTLPAPVILFDSERRAVAANRRACEYLGKGPDAVEGFTGGDIFECRYACLPEGCGNTVHCSGCTLRRLVLDTLIFEKEYRQVPVCLNPRDESVTPDPGFLVSTEKKFNLVLLRIDSVPSGSETSDTEQGKTHGSSD